MKCPNDSATLVMSERAGVEIDYCPDCRGVWLDRGELDKILDRAEQEARTAASRPPASATPAAPPAAPLGGYPEPGRPDLGRDGDRDRDAGDRRDDHRRDDHRRDDHRRRDDEDDRGYGGRDGRNHGQGGYGVPVAHPQGDAYRQGGAYAGKRRKKESWLSELFD